MKKIATFTLIATLVICGMYLRPTGVSEYCNSESQYGFIDSSCWGASVILDRSLYSSNSNLELNLQIPIHSAGALSVLTSKKAKSYRLDYGFYFGEETFSSMLMIALVNHGGITNTVRGYVEKGRYILINETNHYEIYRDVNDTRKLYYLSKDNDFYMRCSVNCWFKGVFRDQVLLKYGFPRKWLEQDYDPLVIPNLVIDKIII